MTILFWGQGLIKLPRLAIIIIISYHFFVMKTFKRIDSTFLINIQYIIIIYSYPLYGTVDINY